MTNEHLDFLLILAMTLIVPYFVLSVVFWFYIPYRWLSIHKPVDDHYKLNPLLWSDLHYQGTVRAITRKKILYKRKIDNLLFLHMFFPFIPATNVVSLAKHNKHTFKDPRPLYRIVLKCLVSFNIPKLSAKLDWPFPYLKQIYYADDAFLFFTTGNNVSRSQADLYFNYDINSSAIYWDLSKSRERSQGEEHFSYQDTSLELAEASLAVQSQLVNSIDNLLRFSRNANLINDSKRNIPFKRKKGSINSVEKPVSKGGLKHAI